MNWRKLWQPKKPAFWAMLALNLLSSVLVWMVQTYPLHMPARIVIAVFAVGNLVLGIRLARALMRDET